MQQLYAAGFNAWGQLQFDPAPDRAAGDPGPEDLVEFTQVLEDAAISHVRPGLAYTAVTTARGLLTAGAAPAVASDAGAGSAYCEALNGRVVVRGDEAGTLLEYPCLAALVAHRAHGAPDPSTRLVIAAAAAAVVDVVAYDVGFAALTADGQVWTWGDGRFPECLGRDVTAAWPAGRPGPVAALQDLPTGPVARVAAGGYVLAALTRGRDLYCWGGYPGRQPVLAGLGGTPAPVVVAVAAGGAEGVGADGDAGADLDTDIVAVGVGDAHMIVLAADGSVYVAGSNANGQLGLGRPHTADGDRRPVPARRQPLPWARVPGIPVRGSQRAENVFAGPRSSFIVTSST